MPVGFDRFLRRTWLDRALELAASGEPTGESLAILLGELESEVKGEEARRKTARRLLRIWAEPPVHLRSMRDVALGLQKHGTDTVVLHWGMAMACHPFFASIAETIGRQLRLCGACDPALVRRRIAAEYGERSTAIRAAERVVQSMIEWETLSRSPDGTLREGCTTVVAPEPSAWLAAMTLHATGSVSRSMENLLGAPMLFPLALSVFTPADSAGQVELMRHGGHREMVVLASGM